MNGWTIDWRGHKFTDEDLTVADVCTCQMLLGAGWASCDPLAGPLELSAMIAAVVARLKGAEVDGADLLAEIRTAPAAELTGAISLRPL